MRLLLIAQITSPVEGQTVNGLVPFFGIADDIEEHLLGWETVENLYGWASGNYEVGKMFIMPGWFGDWNSYLVRNGLHTHYLSVSDSANNWSYDTVNVYVWNEPTEGDGFASGFGSFSSSPMNVATDSIGNVYIAESKDSKVRKFSFKKDSLFAFSVKRGNDTSGVVWATAMAIGDSSSLYVADGYNDCIKKFDRGGNLLLRFGSKGSENGKFREPCGIALDKKNRLWVVDKSNHRVQVFDTTGKYLFGFGGFGTDSGKFNSPTGIAISQSQISNHKFQNVYITDTKNNQVQVFDSTGKYLKTIKNVDSLGFDTPTGICIDRYGDVFIADSKHNRVVELNPYGKRLFNFGKEGDSLTQFRTPIGVAVSRGGHFLYVADLGNKRVQRFWVIRSDTLGGGPQSAEGVITLLPSVYDLQSSYPNPLTGEAMIRYALPQESKVSIKVYNVMGQLVREIVNAKQKAGYYTIKWNGKDSNNRKVSSGVYFYRMSSGSFNKTKKMVVLR